MKKRNLVSGEITIRHTCIIVAKKIDNTARGVLLLYVRSVRYPIRTPPKTFPISSVAAQLAVS